jgi:hypothetical protein
MPARLTAAGQGVVAPLVAGAASSAHGVGAACRVLAGRAALAVGAALVDCAIQHGRLDLQNTGPQVPLVGCDGAGWEPAQCKQGKTPTRSRPRPGTGAGPGTHRNRRLDDHALLARKGVHGARRVGGQVRHDIVHQAQRGGRADAFIKDAAACVASTAIAAAAAAAAVAAATAVAGRAAGILHLGRELCGGLHVHLRRLGALQQPAQALDAERAQQAALGARGGQRGLGRGAEEVGAGVLGLDAGGGAGEAAGHDAVELLGELGRVEGVAPGAEGQGVLEHHLRGHTGGCLSDWKAGRQAGR